MEKNFRRRAEKRSSSHDRCDIWPRTSQPERINIFEKERKQHSSKHQHWKSKMQNPETQHLDKIRIKATISY